MNLIVICIDSLRQDHVSFYNPSSPVLTPNVDQLANRSATFLNVYPEALPTIPIRTQIMTGQRTLSNRPWQPLNRTDRTIAGLLGQYGYTSALITDTYHFFKPGYNFHKGFNVWRWIRGQEYDAFNSSPPKRLQLDDFINDKFPPGWGDLVLTCLKNLDSICTEDDAFSARVFRSAAEWLIKNKRHDNLFLWVDCFDPHEPWYPPDKFNQFVNPSYSGKKYILPPGGNASDYFNEEEIESIRGLYAGEVACVDHYFGEFIHSIEEHGFLDNSILIFLSDHGHPLADHGKFLKGPDRLYNELLKVPLLFHFPGDEFQDNQFDSLGLFHDITATLLDGLGFQSDLEAIQGRSLMPLITGKESDHRDVIVTGFFDGFDRCVRDKSWSYIYRENNKHDELYDLRKDPQEQNNLIDDFPDEALRLSAYLGEVFNTGSGYSGVQGKYEIEGSGAETSRIKIGFRRFIGADRNVKYVDDGTPEN